MPDGGQLLLLAAYAAACGLVGAVTVGASRRWGRNGVLGWWAASVALFQLLGFTAWDVGTDTPIWLTVGGITVVATAVVWAAAALEEREIKPLTTVIASAVGGVLTVYLVAIAGFLLWGVVVSVSS